MKIEHYIARLLYRYQCVTVPGFGAFLTEFQSAQIQESSHAFYPPKKRISFNAHLKNNDGLLANHIAESEKTSYEMAVHAIENEVAIWKDILKVNGHFTLKNIGELALTSEDKIVFSPSEQVNYLTEAFGLSSFVSPKVKREEYKEEVQQLEEKAPIIFTPETRKKRSWVGYAATIALVLSASGTTAFHFYQNRIEEKTLLVNQEVQQKVQDRIQEATFLISNPLPPVTLTVKEEKLNYHVVAGVFRSTENADKACELLKSMGYPARRIPQNKHGLFPVLYGSYANEEQARETMNEIRAKQDPQAWLLVKEF